MKINVDVDCTPEEVRTLLGLPDLSAVHAIYIDKMKSVADTGLTPDMMQQMIRSWVPMGDAGLDFVKQMMGGLGGAKKK
jgi:hypothetical protein